VWFIDATLALIESSNACSTSQNGVRLWRQL